MIRGVRERLEERATIFPQDVEQLPPPTGDVNPCNDQLSEVIIGRQTSCTRGTGPRGPKRPCVHCPQLELGAGWL